MKTLYIDAFSGVSGDKIVAALLSLTDDKDYLLKELSKLGLDNEYKIELIEKSVNGINSFKFNVILTEHHSHEHGHHHTHNHFRNLTDIKKIINDSSISKKSKETALGIFQILGEAEAHVHNTTIDKIHFHEVGAVDSIIDIVSAAILIDFLNIALIYSSFIPTGVGFVNAAHGSLPIPAPATAEILKGIPIYSSEIKKELTTPTGAAILKYLVKEFCEMPKMLIEKIGYGAGTYELEIPNILRLCLGNIEHTSDSTDDITVLETNIDDASPEQLAFLSELLFDKNAVDVFITPVVMKKGRQGQLLTVLCNEEDRYNLEKEIFKNSTTFGIRRRRCKRTILRREIEELQVDGVPVKIKKGWLGDELLQTSIEYESIKAGVDKLGVSYNEFVKRVNRVIG